MAASAALLAACGGDEAPDHTGDAPDRAARAPRAFPKPTGTLDDLARRDRARPTRSSRAASGAVFEPGDKRFGFGLFDVGGAQITDADVAIYAAHGADGEALGPFPARIESLATEPEFVAQTTCRVRREGRLRRRRPLRRDRANGGSPPPSTRPTASSPRYVNPSVIVNDDKEIPDVGEPAPEIHTPTLAEVGGDVESIDTRVPPSTMHGDDLADVLGEKPVVLLFATPALCHSRVCGPGRRRRRAGQGRVRRRGRVHPPGDLRSTTSPATRRTSARR